MTSAENRLSDQGIRMADFKLKSLSQLILVKFAGVVLACIFLSLASLFLSYCFISVASTVKGQEAKVLAVSSQWKNHPTACRWGGFFQLTVEMEKKKYEKIVCLYPAWPDLIQPSPGDIIRVWPVKQPAVGAVPIDSWGWMIVGTLLVVGFVLVEFAFLSLTIR